MEERALPHSFYTAKNLDYVGPYPEHKFYGADFITDDGRYEFLECYEEQKDKMFRNNEELFAFFMYDVNVLR